MADLVLVRAFSYSFPAAAMVMGGYVLLADRCFALSGFVGSRLGSRVRAVARRGFVAANCLFYGALYALLAFACPAETERCNASPLARHECRVAAPTALLLVFAQLLVDRVAVPLLAVSEPAFRTAAVDRIGKGGAVCVVWMGLAQDDPVAVVLASLLLARRAVAPFPIASFASAAATKSALWLLALKTLRRKCEAARVETAVGACLASILL